MNNEEHTKAELIAAGHDPKLVDRTAKAAEGLRAILESTPMPNEDHLNNVFMDEA